METSLVHPYSHNFIIHPKSMPPGCCTYTASSRANDLEFVVHFRQLLYGHLIHPCPMFDGASPAWPPGAVSDANY